MTFINIIKHLLPNSKAFNITPDKTLRKFFEGLATIGDDVKEFADLMLFDILPDYTRELDLWEKQFGLRDTGITTAERRARLDAAWKALGGQSPGYIQDTLQAHGFDVYVHEWWSALPALGVNEQAPARNPLTWLAIAYTTEAGEPLAEAGEPTAEAGDIYRSGGYVLPNILYDLYKDVIAQCGESILQCGEIDAQCGAFYGYLESQREFAIPSNPDYWPYVLYIGGQTFGSMAQVPAERKNEFQELCVKLKPCQQWLGILVEYV